MNIFNKNKNFFKVAIFAFLFTSSLNTFAFNFTSSCELVKPLCGKLCEFVFELPKPVVALSAGVLFSGFMLYKFVNKKIVEANFIKAYKNLGTNYDNYGQDKRIIDIETVMRLLEFIDLDRARDLTKEINSLNTYRSFCSYGGLLTIKIKLLISYDVNKAYSNGNGFTPIIMALLENNIEIIKLLLEKGADVNICSNDGESIFYFACSCGIINKKIDILKLFIENGADINKNCINKRSGGEDMCVKEWNSPLYIACENGHLDVVKLLLESGAIVDEKFISDVREHALLSDTFIKVDNTEILKYLNLANKFDLSLQTGQFFYISEDEKKNEDLCKFKNSLLVSKRAKNKQKSLKLLYNYRGLLKFKDCIIRPQE